ncbi:MAG: GH92 family glycosyl hydrolase [Bacteroidales bacterium]|nr:GH92 family glycosyl hydrolase [Bacteroidales bacterium]
MKRTFFLSLMVALTSCSVKEGGEHLTAFVDPFIGTGFHGHTWPGAAYPFGQIQLSPDNGTQGWDWCSGYHWSDSIISGFGHLHLSGTGIGDLADLLFQPTADTVRIYEGDNNRSFTARYAARFKHDNEKAVPGYYTVTFDNGIRTELTVAERTGYHRYTFPDGQKNLILNLGFAINWDRPYKTSLRIENDTVVTGMRLSTGWAKDQHLYFVAYFSSPIRGGRLYEIDNQAIGVLSFADSKVDVKVGISSVSVENAIANLSASASDGFDAVAQATAQVWDKELGKIKIDSPDATQKKIFYTALYHTMVAPALFSDVNGQYKGLDGATRTADGYRQYTVFSLWDTYRALHPLFTLTQPERVNDMVKSMLDHYRQCGILPVWELEGNETFCMVGNHSITVIAEALLKNIGNFDRELAFEAMKATSLYDRDGMGYHDRLGFIPADSVKQSVAKALEVAIDDHSVAQVARTLGKDADAQYFDRRAGFYRNYFDPETGFMRGKLADGQWTTPFDPTYSNHAGSDYTEGNGWQYLWLVPQDVSGLINLLGGEENFARKLDSLFTIRQGITGEHASADITGLIGQYAHGNEPGHHTSFLFNYADGWAWRTQELNRQIQTEMYAATPDGLCGNEDCGQMSAWYVLSAMGIYPVHPADLLFQLGSPIVRRAEITLGPGRTFTVLAPNASTDNKYIANVTLNGQPLTHPCITWQQIIDGGTLEFTMSKTPNKQLFTNTK